MSVLKQSVILAERKNGIIKQKGVINSNLNREVQDYSANSTIKSDTDGICIFMSNGEKSDGVFIPLSQQKSLIELTQAVANASIEKSPTIDPTNPLDPNYLFLLELKNTLNALSNKAKLILQKIV